jgi:hypothetical protein
MNRKNLTAAVLAGLAGVAGMAGAAQAGTSASDLSVNLNPDGLGEVLLYPYYTTNDDNTTLVTVVNTTSEAKAVKVRFLEGFNSREVLDFNLYLSEYDVWVAAIADSSAFGAAAGVPHLFTPDTSCTVPYIYEDAYVEALGGGLQPFLPYAYSGDNNDGGPDEESSYDDDGNIIAPIPRASEGYLEIIEMGTMSGDDGVKKDALEKFWLVGDTTETLIGKHAARLDSAKAATHVVKEDDDENEYVEPADCGILVENWTEYKGTATKPHPLAGWWLDTALDNCDALDPDSDDPGEGECGQTNQLCATNGSDVVCLDSTEYNSGGLFGGAAIINVPKGTMFSYDAKAVQGFDWEADGSHFYPGTIHPSLNDGNVKDAIVFVGQGNTQRLSYTRGVDAVSAVFMHDELANTFVIDEEIAGATEWVMTFPTKAWYVDTSINSTAYTYYRPDPADSDGCNGWKLGDVNPFQGPDNDGPYGDKGESCTFSGWSYGDDWAPKSSKGECDWPEYQNLVWEFCDTVKNTDTDTVSPFTTTFDGEACEEVTFRSWDREESPTVEGGAIIPPIVSPAPPGAATPGETPFELCYEVNVLRFGEGSVFGTESDLLYTVDGTADEGWARITFAGGDQKPTSTATDPCVACSTSNKELHKDAEAMRGLPVTGFSAEQYTNGQLEGGVLANYGGLFSHKGSVRCESDRVIDDSNAYDCDSMLPK